MGQLGFCFSLNEFLAVLFSFGFTHLKVSRCAFLLFYHVSLHMPENTGEKVSLVLPLQIAIVHCQESWLLSGSEKWEGTKLRNP